MTESRRTATHFFRFNVYDGDDTDGSTFAYIRSDATEDDAYDIADEAKTNGFDFVNGTLDDLAELFEDRGFQAFVTGPIGVDVDLSPSAEDGR